MGSYGLVENDVSEVEASEEFIARGRRDFLSASTIMK